MTKERRHKIEDLFRRYRENKRVLKEEFEYPSIGSVDFGKISIQTDKSRNATEERLINFMDRRDKLLAQVFIVDEVLRWFELEGHGRERFITKFMINGCSWVNAELELHVSRCTIARWKDEVMDKANIIGGWLNYFRE